MMPIAAAWGEARFGAGTWKAVTCSCSQSAQALVEELLSMESYYRGAFGTAAEVGHMRVVPEGHLMRLWSHVDALNNMDQVQRLDAPCPRGDCCRVQDIARETT